MHAIRTLVAIWPAMRAPAMPNRERCGSSFGKAPTSQKSVRQGVPENGGVSGSVLRGVCS